MASLEEQITLSRYDTTNPQYIPTYVILSTSPKRLHHTFSTSPSSSSTYELLSLTQKDEQISDLPRCSWKKKAMINFQQDKRMQGQVKRMKAPHDTDMMNSTAISPPQDDIFVEMDAIVPDGDLKILEIFPQDEDWDFIEHSLLDGGYACLEFF